MIRDNKIKYIRDPIHDVIEIDSDALRIIDTFAFQRLRRIKQMGLGWMVYPSAEHSRFSHSIGAYHIAQKVIRILTQNSNYIFNEDERKSILLAALLHDIGHGPFSHLFESASEEIRTTFDIKYKFNHANIFKRILEDNNQLKKAIDKDILEKIIKIFSEEYTLQHSIISSQLDVDRLDYLLRDCHFTGAKYGTFDLNWLLRNFVCGKANKPKEVEGKEVIAINAKKGLSVLEQYIMGRFYMHKHVYYHKATRGFESIMVNIFKRIYHIDDKKLIGSEELRKIFNGEFEIENFLKLDDYVIFTWMKEWRKNTNDMILKSLIDRIFFRKPLKAIDALFEDKNFKKIDREKDKIKRLYANKDANEYLFFWDDPKAVAYKNTYSLKNIIEEIFVLNEKNEIVPFSWLNNNTIIESKPSLELQINKWYVPSYIRGKYLENERGENGNN